MSKYANRLTEALEPYVPGEQPQIAGLIKLNTNESAFPPGPRVREALANFAPDSLRLYPEPESLVLRQKLAELHGLDSTQVFVGNGSDEILAFIFQAFFEQDGQPLLFPSKTYSFYEVYAERNRIPYEKVPLEPDETIAISAYKRPGQAVILANPNAPTGCLLELPELAALCEQEDRLVVIDEAYIDFALPGHSAVPLIERYPNLLVVQTFSKSRSLAGLRVGMAFGNPELITALSKHKNTFNSYPLDRIAQTLALAALEEPGYYRHCCALAKIRRDRTAEQLRAMGLFVTRSEANFLWVKSESAGVLYQALRDRRILVRYWQVHPEFLRITVGTDEEMEILVDTMAQLVGYNQKVR